MAGAIVKRGERITLRTLESEDVDVLQHGAGDPEIRHLTGNSKVRSRDELEKTLEDDNVTILLVCLDDPGEPGPVDTDDVRRVGVVSVSEWTRNPRVGFWLRSGVQGEGYGREAAALLVDYVFRSYDTPTVKAKAFEHNEASRGLLESLGFEQEGRLRMNAFVDGEYRDGILYGILREEWE
ncbi:GNAT family N-acetyltransferase [Natronobacterium texcoconense]|uniref:Protein N-acetyltransferase, RimJ/RimL family n=1 Tax=Natronobacterium texcoconense TaxID=1095778 RepID=A0A1H1ANP4_NATTX|nr:GNAT family protein [Natronobacterium texcoconense]SDQ41383.1 Protein N-acetyltransferase, RimJ/RimL family [Natronobacterium texcoconense]